MQNHLKNGQVPGGTRLEMVMIDINLKHILCPVDFSECSRHAFDQAVAIARRRGADVTVLHVLPVPSAVPALPYGPEGPGPFGFETVTRDRALAELKRFLATEDAVGVPVHFETAESSNVYSEILQQTSRTAADLVVTGTHGRSGFDHLVLGSVAEKTQDLACACHHRPAVHAGGVAHRIRLDGRAPRQAIDVPGPRSPAAAGILISGSDLGVTRV